MCKQVDIREEPPLSYLDGHRFVHVIVAFILVQVRHTNLRLQRCIFLVTYVESSFLFWININKVYSGIQSIWLSKIMVFKYEKVCLNISFTIRIS